MKRFYNRKSGKLLVAIFSLLMIFPVIAAAQSASGVTGVVTDSAGALVPGVNVVLLDTKTSRQFTTTTSDQGVYVFPNVPPGEGYQLTFTANGFETYIINKVSLGISTTESHNAKLSTGDVSATVEVTSGDQATLNTTDASVGNVVGQRQLRSLPIQIRGNPASLLSLQAGVVGNNVGTGSSNRVGSVTGSRADQGNITVDGIDSNDQASQQAFTTVGNIPIDSIQELRTVTANPGASEGRSSGAQINLATKSGTNDFHGSARIYYRGDKFAANEFFNNKNGVERPGLQRRQFGGSLGGPLPFLNFGQGGPVTTSGKDRLFFFFDYEGRRDDSQTSVSRIVPLQNFRNGSIGFINNNTGCTFQSRQNTTPNCISFLTPAQIRALDPQGIGVNQNLLSYINQRYPLPNDLTLGDGINTGGFRFNAPVTRADNTYTTRIDGVINDKQKVFGRLTLTRRDSTNSVALFPGDPDSVAFSDSSYQVVGGHSWSITSNFFNNFTGGLSAQIFDFAAAPAASFPNSFSFGPITNPFPSLSSQSRDVYTPTFRDDAIWTLGKHTLQFGGSFKPIRQNSTLVNDFNFATIGLGNGLTSFDGDPTLRPGNLLSTSTTARGTYDNAFAFILGRINNVDTTFIYDPNLNPQAPGTGKAPKYVYNEYEFYAADTWRIRSDLTFNYGLRYHLYPAPYESNGLQAANDVDFAELFKIRLANGAAGISSNTSEPFLSYNLIGEGNNARPLYKTDKNNFAPRAGFSYNPSFENGILKSIFGDRKTVIRGGASILYDRVAGAVTFIQDQVNYIFDNSASQTFGGLDPRAALLNDPRFTSITSLPVQNTPPVATVPFTPFINSAGRGIGLADGEFNYAVDQNFEIPYSYQYSFGMQRELPGNFILDVSYVGRKGRKLVTQGDAAQIVDFKDPASGQTLLQSFNALQAQLLAGVPISGLTPQPFLENQLNAGIRNLRGPTLSCANFGVANCTALVANFFRTLAETGGTSDLVQQLYRNRLINPNIGLSSQFAVNAYISNQGYSNYDGMLVSLKRRFAQGLQFDFNYTFSHAIDNQSNITNTVTGGLVFDLRNPEAGKGNADFDIRHLVNANGVWELPIGRGRAIGRNLNKFVDAFVGGWVLSGIFTARSGLPLTSFTGSFPVGFFTNSPSVLTTGSTNFQTGVYDNTNGNTQFFADPNAVQSSLRFPKHGETGNRNVFRSPSFWNLDLAVSKGFTMPWSENHQVTIRAEAYNVFNSVSFGTPNLGINSSNFGIISSTLSSAREIQFAIRYDF